MHGVKQILQEVRKEYQQVLGANLVGIYVHGSIVFDCFHWAGSDIDYIVVVDAPLSFDDKRKLMEKTVLINGHAPSKGIEMSIVLRKDCSHFTYPTPFDLHFSNAYLERYHQDPEDYCRTMCGKDPDLAAHFTIIRNNGMVLCGAAIDSVFGTVDRAYYLDSIKADIENAEQDILSDPVYIILNLCRVAAYIKDDLILSKSEGGRWALRHIPSQHAALLQNTIDCYETGQNPTIDPDTAIPFCRYMTRLISKAS